jgi:hypothetical protein
MKQHRMLRRKPIPIRVAPDLHGIEQAVSLRDRRPASLACTAAYARWPHPHLLYLGAKAYRAKLF